MNANQLLSIFYAMGSRLGRAKLRPRKHWTGEQLREIRRRNGVGRPPAVMLARQAK